MFQERCDLSFFRFSTAVVPCRMRCSESVDRKRERERERERVAQSFVPGNADKSAIFTPERATFYMLVYGEAQIKRKCRVAVCKTAHRELKRCPFVFTATKTKEMKNEVKIYYLKRDDVGLLPKRPHRRLYF